MTADSVVPQGLIGGPHHSIQSVESDGFMNRYLLETPYGPYRDVLAAAMPAVAARFGVTDLTAEEKAALERYNRMISAGRSQRLEEQLSARTKELRDLLRDPTSVRQAILATEILGKPKGLQA